MTDVENWISELRRIAKTYENILIPLRNDQMDMRTSEEAWSINEVLQHLILFNRSYVQLFNNIKLGVYFQPFLGRFHFLARYMAGRMKSSLSTEKGQKTKTIDIWDPRKQVEAEEPYLDYRRQQRKLCDHLSFMHLYTDVSYVVNSPASRKILLPMDEVVELIILHEERHLDQVKRIIEEVLHVPIGGMLGKWMEPNSDVQG